jgi:hypothetical protein
MQKPFIKCVIHQRVGRFLHSRKKRIRRFKKNGRLARYIGLPLILKHGELIKEFTLDDSGSVELLKFSDFDMGSPGWHKNV